MQTKERALQQVQSTQVYLTYDQYFQVSSKRQPLWFTKWNLRLKIDFHLFDYSPDSFLRGCHSWQRERRWYQKPSCQVIPKVKKKYQPMWQSFSDTPSILNPSTEFQSSLRHLDRISLLPDHVLVGLSVDLLLQLVHHPGPVTQLNHHVPNNPYLHQQRHSL